MVDRGSGGNRAGDAQGGHRDKILGSYGQSQMLGSYGQYQGNGVSLINLIQAKLPSMGIKANGNGTTLHRSTAKLQINLLLRWLG